jgi:hypothetical protein
MLGASAGLIRRHLTSRGSTLDGRLRSVKSRHDERELLFFITIGCVCASLGLYFYLNQRRKFVKKLLSFTFAVALMATMSFAQDQSSSTAGQSGTSGSTSSTATPSSGTTGSTDAGTTTTKKHHHKKHHKSSSTSTSAGTDQSNTGTGASSTSGTGSTNPK